MIEEKKWTSRKNIGSQNKCEKREVKRKDIFWRKSLKKENISIRNKWKRLFEMADDKKKENKLKKQTFLKNPF